MGAQERPQAAQHRAQRKQVAMGNLFTIGNKLYFKAKNLKGKWEQVATGRPDTPEGRVAAEAMKREVEAKLDGHRAAARTAEKLGASPKAKTLREYAIPWIDKRDTETVDDDRGRLENHILPVLGDVPLPDLRRRQIQDLIDALGKKKKLGSLLADGTRAPSDELLAPRTVRHIHGTLHAVLESAVTDEIIPTNPATGVELPKKVDKDRKVAPHGQVRPRRSRDDHLGSPRADSLRPARWGCADVPRCDAFR